jgi:hypothetical protein
MPCIQANSKGIGPMPLSALALFSSLAAFSLPGQPAFAKQCVWNKAGFVLHVAWLKPDGKLIKTANLPINNGSCIDDDAKNNIAALSISGGKVASGFTRVAIGTLVGLLPVVDTWELKNQLKDAVPDPAQPSGYPTELKDILSEAIPDPEALFWAGVPSKDGNYLDVWGSIWSPQVSPGGPVN